MDEASLFCWLSEVHLRKQTHDVVLQEVLALAMYVQFSNDNCWTDVCYHEVLSLGDTSGLHFGEYYRCHVDTYILRGTTPAHPILIESDAAKENSTDSGESRPWSVSYNFADDEASSQVSSPTSDGAARSVSELIHGACAVATPMREPAQVT